MGARPAGFFPGADRRATRRSEIGGTRRPMVASGKAVKGEAELHEEYY